MRDKCANGEDAEQACLPRSTIQPESLVPCKSDCKITFVRERILGPALQQFAMISLDSPKPAYSNFAEKSVEATNPTRLPTTAIVDWYPSEVPTAKLVSIESVRITESSASDNLARCCAEIKGKALPLSTFRVSGTRRRTIAQYECDGEVVRVSTTSSEDPAEVLHENHIKNEPCCMPVSLSILPMNRQRPEGQPSKPDAGKGNAVEARGCSCPLSFENLENSSNHIEEYKQRFELHTTSLHVQCCENSKKFVSVSHRYNADRHLEAPKYEQEVKMAPGKESCNDELPGAVPEVAKPKREPLFRRRTFNLGREAGVGEVITDDSSLSGMSRTSFSRKFKSRFSFRSSKHPQQGTDAKDNSTDHKPAKSTNITIDIPIGQKIGIKLGGGCTTAYGDGSIFVSAIVPGSFAAAVLRKSDRILSVNGFPLEDVTLLEADKLLENLPPGKTVLTIQSAK